MADSSRFLTILCHLVRETEKAIQLHWDDEDNDVNMQIWVPKKCIEEDDFDREVTLQKLRSAARTNFILVDVAVWWIQDQEWFDESIQELIDLD